MRLAVERVALPVAQDRVFGWFGQRDVDEAGARGQAAVPLEDPAGGLDLLRRQRVQHMRHSHSYYLRRTAIAIVAAPMIMATVLGTMRARLRAAMP